MTNEEMTMYNMVEDRRVEALIRQESIYRQQKQPQRQDSLKDQLITVHHLASQAGCWDAADFIKSFISKEV